MKINFAVVHSIAGLNYASGGVARSVPRLCEALAQEDRKTVLITQKPRASSIEDLRLPQLHGVDTRLIAGHDWPRLRFSYTPGLRQRFESICSETERCVLHDHGMWLQMNHTAALVARTLGIKRVVSPRGTLEPWSLRYRRWKKALAWRVYQRGDLLSADAFSVTSADEATALRNMGFRQAIAIIPNGIDLPDAIDRPTRRPFVRTALFMSRLHPKKGLLELVEAWSSLGMNEWRLVIAGPDEDGYRRVVEHAVDRAGLRDAISFTGNVEGAVKDELLRTADIFVLPSHSENFGIVVGEALTYGVPVITTKATPWQMLEVERCGWWTDTGANALASALREAMALTDAERAQMGRRGRAMVEERYSWRGVAKRHIELYDWLNTGSTRPAWIDA